MNETILFAPGAGGTDLVRSMAGSGNNTLGLRAENAVGLAKTALMRSGITVKEQFLTRREEPSVFNSFIKTIPYFASASYADCEHIAQAVFTARSLVADDEAESLKKILSGGEFLAKNEALIGAYEKYIAELKKSSYIDTIGIIRKAAAEAVSMVSGTEFIILQEYPLSVLERTLLEKVSGGNYKEISLSELYGRGSVGNESKDLNVDVSNESSNGITSSDAHNTFNDITITDSYGSSNEIEDIIAYIYGNNIPLDKCVVAAADNAGCAQLFYDYSKQYDIPVTFGNGVPINNSNPATLLKLLNDWDTKGYNGVNALGKVVESPAFDRSKLFDDGLKITKLDSVIKMAGQLRISYDGEENTKRIKAYRDSLEKQKATYAEGSKHHDELCETLQILTDVEKLAGEFSKGCLYMLNEYSVIRDGFTGRVDRSALGVITDTIGAYAEFSDGNISEIIPEILNKTVCSEISREGELYVTSIRGALSSLRPYLFITGMSSSNFPGSPSENYLLLDSDYMLFGSEGERFISANVINNKKESLDNLLKTAASLGVQVRLSYSSYNLAGHKEDNPSSSLFEIYSRINPGSTMDDFNKSLRHVGFFENRLNAIAGLGNAYNNNVVACADMPVPEEEMIQADRDRAWSPSALEVFFQCPRRFYLTKIAGVKEPEDDDPFTVINANQLGTLAHSQMEHLAEKQVSGAGTPAQPARNLVSLEEFLKRAGDEFDDFLLSRPPVHPDAVAKEKRDFLKMMKVAYDTDPGYEVLSAEEKWTVEHECGVKISGYPDRIEKTEDGSCLIADYKTKRRVEHVENDVDTCIQVMLYAYMAQANGIPVTSSEYRYIRLNEKVTCKFDDAAKDKLSNKLEQFKAALEAGVFPCNPGEKTKSGGYENCKYCKCSAVCGREKEAD